MSPHSALGIRQRKSEADVAALPSLFGGQRASCGWRAACQRVCARMITPEQVREKLSTVKYPGFSRDIVSFGLVKDVRVTGVDVLVQMALATNDPKIPQAIKDGSEAALAQLPGVGQVTVRIDIQAPPQAAASGRWRADGGGGDRGRQARHRRGQRKGRRGQIDGGGEPRHRPAPDRAPRWASAIAIFMGRASA